jgi:hypothetical protein
MTTPARQQEADRVELVYYWALNQLGNQVYLDAWELWQNVPKSGQAANAGWWLRAAIRLVMLRRAQARDLAIAYYRLVRALRTGYTITDPLRDEDGTVSLEELRIEFEAEVDEIDFETSDPPSTDASDSLPVDLDSGPAPEYDEDDYDEGDEEIPLEDLIDLDELAGESDEAAEAEAEALLDQLGIENMLHQLQDAEEAEDAAAADAAADEAHANAGRRQAAVAQRITMNAARGLAYDISAYDGRVLGWVRYSQTGTPCGWCAMLLSRQMFYKSKRAAQHEGRGQTENKYHDNCRCVAVPIFTKEQFEQSSLFDLNRDYARRWKQHISGKFTGKEALTEWRRLVRGWSKNAQAQEAA